MSAPPPNLAFGTSDGWTLHLGVYPPPAAASAAVLVMPAMMVDRRSCDRPAGSGLASTLATSGLAVYTLDFRGHGDSAPRPEAGGDWTYDDLVRIDIPEALEAVRARHPSLPLVALGHSLGGHGLCASLSSAGAGPIDAAVLVGANIWVRELEPSPLHWAQKCAQVAAFAAVTRVRGYFPSRALRLGSASEGQSYVFDFWRWIRHGWLSRDGHDYLAGLANMPAIPILALNGAGDRLLCRTPCARRFVGRFGAARVAFREVAASDLLSGPAPDHMTVVVDARARPVWHDIAAWIHDTVQARAAG